MAKAKPVESVEATEETKVETTEPGDVAEVETTESVEDPYKMMDPFLRKRFNKQSLYT